jgi:hypothetical protein
MAGRTPDRRRLFLPLLCGARDRRQLRRVRDHIAGFFLILIVTGAIIAGLGWRFWKGRRDITLLIIGVVQAAFGIVVYIQRYHVHG